MLFRRILIHEMTNIALAVFSVLLVIMILIQVVGLLGQAAVGVLASNAVWGMIGFSVIRFLPVLLSLTLFISVIFTLTRLYRDHEMAIWLTSGQSIQAFIRPVLQFAGLPILLLAVLSIVVSPWAVKQSKEFRSMMMQQESTSKISSGIFRSNGNIVYFAENALGVSSIAKNVFVQQKYRDKLNIVLAERGRLVQQEGERFLHLENGLQYLGVPGSADYIVSHFEQGIVPIHPLKYVAEETTAKAKDILALLKNPTLEEQAELQVRLAWPISTIVLILMAIPLAHYHPRRGGSFTHLLFGIIIFFLYQNMISMAQRWIEREQITSWIGMWLIHISAFSIMIGLFLWRKRIKS